MPVRNGRSARCSGNAHSDRTRDIHAEQGWSVVVWGEVAEEFDDGGVEGGGDAGEDVEGGESSSAFDFGEVGERHVGSAGDHFEADVVLVAEGSEAGAEVRVAGVWHVFTVVGVVVGRSPTKPSLCY